MNEEEIGFLIEYIVGGGISIKEAESILEWKPGKLEDLINEVMTFRNEHDRINTRLIKRSSKMNIMKLTELEPSTLLNKVAEFQKSAGETLNDDTPAFREALHREETQETIEALTISDEIETLDGLVDIEVINLGSANILGNTEHVKSSYALITDLPATVLKMPLNMIMQNLKQLQWNQHGLISYFVWSAALSLGYSKQDFLEAFMRVHESNMSKFCLTEGEAKSTVAQYKLNGVETYYKIIGGRYVVKRTSDHKTLKSILYRPVQLADIVERVYGK